MSLKPLTVDVVIIFSLTITKTLNPLLFSNVYFHTLHESTRPSW